MRFLTPFLLLVSASCGGGNSGHGGGRDAAPDTASAGGSGTPRAQSSSCTGTTNSSLQGVRIVFANQPCTFSLAQAGAGIGIAYDVVIDTTLRGVVTLPQDVGGASLPGECGLVLFEELTGGSEHYCLCDSGLGSGEKRIVDLVAGTYRSAFKWTGRNWYGPSDTGVPMGAPFPVGSYTLRVSAVGSYLGADYTISATFPIWLTP